MWHLLELGVRALFGPCFLCWSSTKQATEPYSDNLLNRTRNPSEPYSDKEIPFRRASRRFAFLVGFSTGIHRKLGLSPLGTAHETVLGHRQNLLQLGVFFATFLLTVGGFLLTVELFYLHRQPASITKCEICNSKPQIWLEIITSRDAKSTCFKGSRTSHDVIDLGIFKVWPEKITSRDGYFLLITVVSGSSFAYSSSFSAYNWIFSC